MNVRHGQQDRGGGLVEVDILGGIQAPLQIGEEPFGLEAGQEQHLDLGAGLLGAQETGDPLAGHDIDDAVDDRGSLTGREVTVGVGPERPAGLSAGGFLRPALRTGRATFTASGSPRVQAAGAAGPGVGSLAHGVGILVPR